MDFYNQDVCFARTTDAHFSATTAAIYTAENSIVRIVKSFLLIRKNLDSLILSCRRWRNDNGSFRFRVASYM